MEYIGVSIFLSILIIAFFLACIFGAIKLNSKTNSSVFFIAIGIAIVIGLNTPDDWANGWELLITMFGSLIISVIIHVFIEEHQKKLKN